MDKSWFTLRGIKIHLTVLGLISLLLGAAIIGQALFLAQGISVLFQEHPLEMAYKPFILFLVCLFARYTIVWIQRKVAGRFAEKATERMREQLIEGIFGQHEVWLTSGSSAEKITLVMEGVDKVRTYLELAIPRFVDMMVLTLVLWGWTMKLDLISGGILTVTLPLLVTFFILLGLAAKTQAERQWTSYRVLSHHYTDALRGLKTLKYLGRSKDHGKTIRLVSDNYRKATMKTLRVAFLSSFALDFFSMLSIAMVAVSLGIRLIDGSMGFTAALTVLLLTPEVFLPVRMLGSDYHASLDGREAWQAIRNMLNTLDSNRKDMKEKSELEPNHRERVQPLDSDPFHLSSGFSISLSDVVVTGENEHPVINRISASFSAQTAKLGLIGMSGAGKTTLLHLLAGLIEPAEGSFQVNGIKIEGDVRLLWQQQVALIPQHPHIFSQSVLDNLRFYCPDATTEQAEEIIDVVGLRSLIDALPSGIHEPIGEGGRSISGGQAQRIALGRALLSKRPILILDEPTSHLDIETEWELKQMILKLLSGKHLLLATHRLHWMKEMECVWLMNSGELTDCGTSNTWLTKTKWSAGVDEGEVSI
ncbi:thiol reductant ABC exporter subunit CydD [Paenibacillus gallinarum]|uniref:Thiol reductant ABC exporter subunit CydD n=1 Tax=Paenibacillus gallinarum TaxID=2762232 RepID=A0ABR8T1A9_9BACL|nr:thiol reductant ABC exporter subunit CydD [Paenibacillus gallinarum]MBD7969477.1 thiol reductant ABC exporter subunit CydD [Paenibacillus gallinarum]